MTIEQVRGVLSDGGFTPEVHAAMSSILDAAAVRGSLTDDEKEKLLNLIDLDIEAADIEADTMTDMASALDEFAQEADEAIKTADADFEKIEAELLAELQALTPEAVAA